MPDEFSWIKWLDYFRAYCVRRGETEGAALVADFMTSIRNLDLRGQTLIKIEEEALKRGLRDLQYQLRFSNQRSLTYATVKIYQLIEKLFPLSDSDLERSKAKTAARKAKDAARTYDGRQQ